MVMDRTNQIMVHVRESHQYGIFRVHDGIEFDVRVNEFLCVCGPSGCGKTTLLDILSGLMKPTEGAVLIHSQPVNPKKQNISFVFQEPSTLPWLTVWDNIAVGLRVKKRPKDEVRRVVDDIIDVVGLRGFERHYPHQISGGMKQRVAIARAFATDADLILMDEPFVSLDQPTRERMQREVLDIWAHRKRTIVFVTHNLEEAVFLGDRVIILSAKPARIRADLEVTLPRPRDPLSIEFTALRAHCAALLSELSAVSDQESGQQEAGVRV
ncbi:MAG: ABC transporter ATP-binding protein [Rhodocyclaceae bacterium]|nr:ABC transporter ATP-binding protein [Rhodocyclaceae bacterium]